MSINRKNIIRNYTIVEVMVAMGIFLIMMTIMMQFFTSAQKVWNASAKRNMIYADARVAMNLMTREIQCMLYDNDDTDGSDIYPFWLEWTDLEVSINTGAGENIPQELEDHWVDQKDLPEKNTGASPKDAYLTVLNFITTTDLKPADQGSDVCEIRYKFVPAYFTTSSPTSVNDVKGGKLQRSCTAEYANASQLTNDVDSNKPYDYSDFPLLASTDPSRVVKIWGASSSSAYKTVINGVYSLRFSCYKWVSGTGLDFIKEMDSNGLTVDTSSIDFTRATGTPCPLAVRIDMKLMDPKDLKKLALNIYLFEKNGDKEAEKQVKTLKQKIRTFSKVIYLGKK